MTNWARRMRQEGGCTECGKKNDRAPMWVCSGCAAKMFTPARRAQNRAYLHALYVKRRAEGRCARCGAPGCWRFAWCLACRQTHCARRSGQAGRAA